MELFQLLQLQVEALPSQVRLPQVGPQGVVDDGLGGHLVWTKMAVVAAKQAA